MIFYRDNYEFDSSIGQTIHGTYFPPFFFDNIAAREHWGITEQPVTDIVETFQETESEQVTLTEAPIKPKRTRK